MAKMYNKCLRIVIIYNYYEIHTVRVLYPVTIGFPYNRRFGRAAS